MKWAHMGTIVHTLSWPLFAVMPDHTVLGQSMQKATALHLWLISTRGHSAIRASSSGFSHGPLDGKASALPQASCLYLWSENCVSLSQEKRGSKAWQLKWVQTGKWRICPLTSELIFCFLHDPVENWAQNSVGKPDNKGFYVNLQG